MVVSSLVLLLRSARLPVRIRRIGSNISGIGIWLVGDWVFAHQASVSRNSGSSKGTSSKRSEKMLRGRERFEHHFFFRPGKELRNIDGFYILWGRLFGRGTYAMDGGYAWVLFSTFLSALLPKRNPEVTMTTRRVTRKSGAYGANVISKFCKNNTTHSNQTLEYI